MLVLAALADPPVSIHYNTLSQAEIERRLRAVESSDAKREQKLVELFQESGCTAEHLSEPLVKHSRQPNVVCTLPGTSSAVILVGGHFDFVTAGKGVVDNWSGCSLLPSLYMGLKAFPHRHTFRFVGFTDEEKGSVGSRFYVSAMPQADLTRIRAMVNLDSLGTTPTKVEIDRADQYLINALAMVAANLKLPLSPMNVHRVGRSDSDSFQDRHVPTVNIHSMTNDTFPILHTRRDQMEAIHMNDYYARLS